MRASDSLLTDAALGAAAGVAATWVMGLATTYLYDHEDGAARQREDAARGGKTTYGILADKAAGGLGLRLSDGARKRLGAGIHWALGAGGGAAYGILRRRLPLASAGQGLAYGAAFFAVMDEGANTALGLTPPPAAFPWQAHARGLAGHLVYGLVTDTLLDAADLARG